MYVEPVRGRPHGGVEGVEINVLLPPRKMSTRPIVLEWGVWGVEVYWYVTSLLGVSRRTKTVLWVG